MRISLESNIRAVARDLSDAARKQVPFATSIALNETGKILVELNKRQMARAFKSPTRWTLNAFYFRRSSKSRLFIKIERKWIQARKDYLLRQVEGGPRPKTGLERRLNASLGRSGFVVPTKYIRKNRYGNVTAGQYQKILSGLKAQNDPLQNETKSSGARKRRSRAARYFTPAAGSRLSPGVYSRQGRAKPKKILAFTGKTPRYQKRFKFYYNMNNAASRVFPKQFERALARAWATRRK
jgi:hypothetical protein